MVILYGLDALRHTVASQASGYHLRQASLVSGHEVSLFAEKRLTREDLRSQGELENPIIRSPRH